MDFHSLNIDLCTILDALEDPIHIIDTDGILVFANLAWEKLIGLPGKRRGPVYQRRHQQGEPGLLLLH